MAGASIGCTLVEHLFDYQRVSPDSYTRHMSLDTSESYDEFSLFADNASDAGLPYDGPPTVRRVLVEVNPGQRMSLLVWGDGPAKYVFIHGGAQNAHTWDTTILAMGRPNAIAVDLPGHGHSDW